MTARIMPWLGGAILTGCAVFFSGATQRLLLIVVMLFWPLVDRRWTRPATPRGIFHILAWAAIVAGASVLLATHPAKIDYAWRTLLFAALPEEFFFRSYFMGRVGSGGRANVMTSAVFATLHVLARSSISGILVFLPSLFYGYMFQRSRDLPLVVLLHAISNLIYILWWADWFRP